MLGALVPDSGVGGSDAEAIAFGYNKHSFSLLVDIKKFEPMMKNLHKEFFEKHPKNIKLFEKVKK